MSSLLLIKGTEESFDCSHVRESLAKREIFENQHQKFHFHFFSLEFLLYTGTNSHKRLLQAERVRGNKRMVVIGLPHFALSYSIRQWRLQGKTRNWSLGRINQAFRAKSRICFLTPPLTEFRDPLAPARHFNFRGELFSQRAWRRKKKIKLSLKRRS